MPDSITPDGIRCILHIQERSLKLPVVFCPISQHKISFKITLKEHLFSFQYFSFVIYHLIHPLSRLSTNWQAMPFTLMASEGRRLIYTLKTKGETNPGPLLKWGHTASQEIPYHCSVLDLNALYSCHMFDLSNG